MQHSGIYSALECFQNHDAVQQIAVSAFTTTVLCAKAVFSALYVSIPLYIMEITRSFTGLQECKQRAMICFKCSRMRSIMPIDDEVLTTDEAAVLLRVTPNWLRKATREGRAPVQPLRVGSHLRWSRSAILDALRQPQGHSQADSPQT